MVVSHIKVTSAVGLGTSWSVREDDVSRLCNAVSSLWALAMALIPMAGTPASCNASSSKRDRASAAVLSTPLICRISVVNCEVQVSDSAKENPA